MTILIFSETCFDAGHMWAVKERRPPISQCELWEEIAPHRRKAAELAKLLVFKYGKKLSTQNRNTAV